MWRTYLLYPASNLEIGEVFAKIDDFLTTEEGAELGALMESELHLDSPFKPQFQLEIGDYLIRHLGLILKDAIGLDPKFLEKPIQRYTKNWKPVEKTQ